MLLQLCRRCGSFLRCLNMSPRPSLTARCQQQRSLCMFRRTFPVNRCRTFTRDFMLTQKVCAKHIRWSRTESSTESANVEDSYELGYIYVKTSIDRWFEVPEGVEFDVGFVDSMPIAKINSKTPVILGLPSSLGSHKDLMNVLLVFVKLGCRVIIPNMPSSSLCMCRSRSETTVFMNSPDEKAEFVRDFLAELNINKVDMLVTDSDSAYTALYLCNQNENIVKAFAMINPTGLDYTKFMLPRPLFSCVNKMWEEVFFAQSIVWCMLFILKSFTRKRHLSVNEFITLSKTITTLDFKQILEEAEAYRGQGVATLALYRDDCEQLTRGSTEELLHSLGVEEPSITVYDQHDNVVIQGIRDSNQWGFLFQGDVGDIKETKAKLVRTKLLEFYKNHQKAEEYIRPVVRKSQHM